MATKEKKIERKEPAFTHILKGVHVSVNPRDKWALVTLVDEDGELLEEAESLLEESPAEVNIVDGVALFRLSKFAKIAFGDEDKGHGLEDHEGGYINLDGNGIANIKVRHADYDWTYKKKSGHTSCLEIIGIRFTDFEPYNGNELAGL